MKSTKYTRFCRRLFAKTFKKMDIEKTSKNHILEKADIAMVYQEYYSMVLMNIVLGFFSAFFSSFTAISRISWMENIRTSHFVGDHLG